MNAAAAETVISTIVPDSHIVTVEADGGQVVADGATYEDVPSVERLEDAPDSDSGSNQPEHRTS